jgi:hypothetical protein
MFTTNSPYGCAQRAARRSNVVCGEGDGPLEKARISDVAFVKKGLITGGDFATISAKIKTLEAACNAFVIRDLIGSYDGGTPTEAEVGGRSKTKTVNRAHVVSLSDRIYAGENEDFWSVMEEQAAQYDVFLFTEKRAWVVQNTALKIVVKPEISNDPDAYIAAAVTLTWSKLALPRSIPFDRGILEDAPFLPFVSLTSVGGAGTVTNQTTVTVPENDPIEVTALFTGATGYELRGLDEAGLGESDLTATAAGHVVSAAGLSVGTYQIFVRGTNACGILGEVGVKLVVTA